MIMVFLIITGLIIGVISAFFGVGGGIIAVPALYTVFPTLSPQTVIGCSLGMIFFNSLINCFHFIRANKKPDLKIFISFGVFTILGGATGSYLATKMSPDMIKKVFVLSLVMVIIRLLFFKKTQYSNSDWQNVLQKTPYFKSSLIGTLGGMTSGLTGLGGGAVMVPLFLSVLKMPFHLVSVYSNAAMVLTSFSGGMTFLLANPPMIDQNIPQASWLEVFQIGQTNFLIIFALVLGSSLTSFLGVKLSAKVSAEVTQKLFAFMLCVFAIKIWFFS